MSAPRLLGELRLSAQPDCLRLARGCVREAAKLAGCDDATVDNLVLAVNEACMNVIQHGYSIDCAAHKEMCLQIWLEDAALVFDLLDCAPPVCAEQVQPRSLDEIRPGGLGVHFMRSIMDEVIFAEPPQGFGNRLRMVKRLRKGASTHGA
jgi:anti-sigma regulatory factor (Ser/Thr protein kinase)